jgi:hypothetical protein
MSLSRGDLADVRQRIDALVPDEARRRQLLSLLADAIETAHATNAASWDLTLAPSGRFLRLNVGRIMALDIASGDSTVVLEEPAVTMLGRRDVGQGPRREAKVDRSDNCGRCPAPRGFASTMRPS